MGITLLVFLTVSALAQSWANVLPEHSEEWESFKIKYSKEYSTPSEEIQRREIFLKNLEHVRGHNARYVKGETSYSTRINEYSDWTHEEFIVRRTGLRPLRENENNRGKLFSYPTGITLPSSVDWREKGAVTPVKNQGQCGSCWAFSAVGSLEGQHFLSSKKLVSLSEQNLLDCAPNDGCLLGGNMQVALSYVITNGGIDTEDSYPYEGHQDKCQYNSKTIGATVKDIVTIPSGNESALQAAVALHGPITVAVDATPGWQAYKTGVLDDPTCSSNPKSLNHGVVVVGYGTTKDGDAYWLVKNSWGTEWGQQGYIMVARNKNNMCGIATYAMYPVV